MQTYKTLLQNNHLHNQPSLQSLLKTKQTFCNLLLTLQKKDEKIQKNLHTLKTTLKNIEQSARKVVENVGRDLGDLEEMLLEERKRGILGGDVDGVLCGCGWVGGGDGQGGREYLRHLNIKHKSYRYVEGSSHFVTLFGNLVRCKIAAKPSRNSSKNQPISPRSPSPKNNDTQATKVKTRRKKTQPKPSPSQSPSHSSSHSSQSIPENHKKTKTCNSKQSPSNQPQPQPEHQHQHQPQSQPQPQSPYYCGECLKNMDTYRQYVSHLQVHDFIVHPNSSHILIRKGRRNQAMSIRVDADNGKKFYCNCNPGTRLSRQAFVAHVLKWHKGIAPKK